MTEKANLSQKAKEEADIKKAELMAEFDLRAKRELEEFTLRINEMRITLETER